MIGLLATTLVVGSAIALTGLPGPRPGVDPSRPAATDPPVAGPVVYYEILDADGSSLMERRLDGRSLPRRVAQRTDVDFGRTWTVDPAGRLAVAVVPGAADQELIGVAVANGATVWQVRTPNAPVDGAVWAADGSRFAVSTLGAENALREVLVVDASSGRFVRGAIPEDAILQGFERDGSLVLRQRLEVPQAVTAAWRFLRFDPATSTVERLGAAPDVGPASDWSEDVDPAAGLAVDSILADGDTGTVIRLWRLAGGKPRAIASFASVDRIALDPTGSGVAVGVAQTIRYIPFDGTARDVYSGDEPIADFGWSAGGDYLAVSMDRPGANLTVVEGATGRSVLLPQPDPVAQSLFVRIVGGVRLPADPLPASEPGPTPTTPPSGPDVAEFDGILAAWTERSPTGHEILHLDRLVPTEGGGLRVAASMPVVDLGPEGAEGEGPASVTLLPRPGTADVLAWVQGATGSSGWLWDGATSRSEMPLPADWPADAYDVAWRPDGRALAASAGQATADGDFEGIFAIAVLGAARTVIVPVTGEFDRLEGWWSASELRVGHGICTERCDGRYSYSARLRISDRHLIQLTPADRAIRPIDVASPDRGSIVLSMINDDRADDVTIDWPSTADQDTADVIGFGADGRTLLVAVRTGNGTDIEAIDDPIGRAVGGRLLDPRPSVIGHLAGRGLRVDVSPDQAWALTTDRVENVRLVRLSDGRSWPVDRDRMIVWF